MSPRSFLPVAARFVVAGALLLIVTACRSDGPSGPDGSVASVQLSASATSVAVNSTVTLSAVARDGSGGSVTGATITWASSVPGVATVTADGVVRGVGTGTTVISASAGTKTSTLTMTVTPDVTPASIAVTPASAVALVSGQTQTLTAVVRSGDGVIIPGAQTTLASSDPTVASVSGNVITSAKVGTATITATSGSASTTIVVSVSAGAPAVLALRTAPGGTTVGLPLNPQPVVEITDRAGNLVNTQLAVTVRIVSGGGTLTGTTTITSLAGVAAFTDLTVIGFAGARVLGFSTLGLLGLNSAPIALTAATTPLIALDSTAVSITVGAARTSNPVTIGIQNGGTPPFIVTTDAPTYDAGQPTGWLIATLSGTTAPFTLTLQANAASLQPGSYTARLAVRVAGAVNSPVIVVVSLTVVPSTVITFGSATEKLRVLDIGATYAPSLAARDGNGQPISPGPVSYVSRATTIATVDAQGTITARGEGQVWVAVIGATTSDSVHVIVPKNTTGPVLRSDAGTYLVAPGVATFYNVVLDTRSVAIGAATVIVGFTTATGVFNSVTWTIPTGPPVPVVNSPLGGIVRVSIASATALSSQLVLLRLRVVAPTVGTNGAITLTVTDIVDANGTDLMPVTTSTRLPIVVQ